MRCARHWARSPTRIARQLMHRESGPTAGGLLGLILVYAGVPALVRSLPADLAHC